MAGLLLFGFLLFAGALGLAALLAVGVALKLLVRLVLLPLFLIKWLVSGLVLMIVGPVLALVGVVLCLVFGALFALPLLPLALVAGFVWLLVRAGRRPALI